MALAGDLHVRFWTEPRSFLLVLVNLATVAGLSLASEMAFRGYPYRRLIDAIGPTWATIVMALLFAGLGGINAGAGHGSTAITVLFGLLLCAAWLRTHGLWLGWGLHFAWIASIGILFGFPVNGLDNISTVVQTRAIGPDWLTGGDFGPEGALLTADLPARRHRRARPLHPRLVLELHASAHRARRLPDGRRRPGRAHRHGKAGQATRPGSDPAHHARRRARSTTTPASPNLYISEPYFFLSQLRAQFFFPKYKAVPSTAKPALIPSAVRAEGR